MKDLIRPRCSSPRQEARRSFAKLESRLARVEADNRRLRRGAGLAAALFVAAALTGMRPTPLVADVLAAKSFQLVDASGRLRGIWTVRDDGVVSMAVLDEMGEQLSALELSGDGPPAAALQIQAEPPVAEQDGGDSFDWAD